MEIIIDLPYAKSFYFPLLAHTNGSIRLLMAKNIRHDILFMSVIYLFENIYGNIHFVKEILMTIAISCVKSY